MYDLLIRGGRCVLPHGTMEVDIAVRDGRIAAIGRDLGEARQVIEATGQLVLPGVVDGHVHISEPGRTHWEGYETATRAAAKGGVTCIVEMPINQLPATIDRATLRIKLEAGRGKLMVDVASLGGLVPDHLFGISELDSEGVVGYKAFMSSSGDPNIAEDLHGVDDYQLWQGMKAIAATGKPLCIHAENAPICDQLTAAYAQAGRTDMLSYPETRPVLTEVEAVRRAIYLARQTGCRLHICHLSSVEAAEEVARARREGMPISSETCLHYLIFTSADGERLGTTMKCSPPIRGEEQRQGLWQRLLAGEIDMIVSDHSPCPPEMKQGEPLLAWGGISALQSSLELLFDELVLQRGRPETELVRLLCSRPAELFGLSDRKGSLELGKDADIVLLDARDAYTLSAEDLEYRHQISPYIGRRIGARVSRTLLRGQQIYAREDGFAPPCGDYLFAAGKER